jgi:DNA-binding NarL/FixJ family response regulator
MIRRTSATGRTPTDALGRALTDRERDMLRAVAEAGSVSAAASRLGVAEQTVRSHLARVYRKLGATSAAQAVWRAFVDGRDRAPVQKTAVSNDGVKEERHEGTA